MSLEWIWRNDTGHNQVDTTNGKKVGGLHPLQDFDDGVTSASPEERRRRVISDSKLVGQWRHPNFLNRDAVKDEVLATYTSNVPIHSYITLDEEKISDQERARMRAERLGGDGGSTQANQVHLIRLIEGLDSDLKTSWNGGGKVQALRLAIQASKLLNVNKAPHSYPSIFILVATVLDSFGNFVAERLQATAAGNSFVVASLIKRGQDASLDLIPAEAIEMCYNWFLKISSIRELLPRICIELSLLKCNKFLAKKARVQPSEVVGRLARQIRGVADPLVASHLRWYLFLRAAEVLKTSEDWAVMLETTCMDTFATMEQLKSPYFEKLFSEKDITRNQYLSLFIPSLQWQLDCVAKYGNKGHREKFIRGAFEAATRTFQSTALLLPLLRAFEPCDLLKYGADVILFHIDEVEPCKLVSKLKLLEVLALTLAEHDAPFPLSRAKRTALLNEIWSRVEILGSDASCDLEEFIGAVGGLLQFCAVHMGPKQVNLLLNVTRKIVDTSNAGTQLQKSIFRLLSGLLTRLDISSLLASDHFLPLLRFVDPASRSLLAQTTLALIPTEPQYASITLELAKTLNETFDVLNCGQDAIDECTATIVSALRRVASPDAERQIEVMCEARHALPNLDLVKVALVDHALSLVHQFGKNTRKRNAAKAFLAFCHVTIPAAANPFSRTKMAIEAAGTAFLYGFVAQGEAILRLAMEFMKEMTPTTTRVDGTVESNSQKIREQVLLLVGIGSATPSHAKYGHNYVLSAILVWNDNFAWEAASTGRGDVYCALMRSVSSAVKGRLAYRFQKCATENYTKDTEYLNSCAEIVTKAASNNLAALKAVGDRPSSAIAVGLMAMDLLETAAVFGACCDDDAVFVREVTSEAWALANKFHTGTDVNYTRQLARLSNFLMTTLGDGFDKITNLASCRLEKRAAQQKDIEPRDDE